MKNNFFQQDIPSDVFCRKSATSLDVTKCDNTTGHNEVSPISWFEPNSAKRLVRQSQTNISPSRMHLQLPTNHKVTDFGQLYHMFHGGLHNCRTLIPRLHMQLPLFWCKRMSIYVTALCSDLLEMCLFSWWIFLFPWCFIVSEEFHPATVVWLSCGIH